MEHRAVGGVHLVGAEHPAGAHDADGGLLLEHGAGLHGAGLGTKHHVIVDIEGVLRVPGGMVLGHIQQFKIVQVQLHFGAFHHGKAHGGEAVQHFVEHQIHGMLRAHGGHGPGLGHVDGLFGEPCFLFLPGQLRLLFIQQGGELFPGLVDDLTHLGPLLGAQLPHTAQQRRQAALFAQHLHPQGVQGGQRFRAFQFFSQFLADLRKIFPNIHVHRPPIK